MKKDTVLPYPGEFYSLLNIFKPCLKKKQFNNFYQITSGIVLSSHSTISRFSKMFEERGASSLNKFLTQSPWSENKVKHCLHKTLFNSFPDLDVFIGDDTLSEKPFAKVMEGVASHYSNLKKTHCNGHSIVTTGFYTKEGCIPFDSQLYFRKETAEHLERKFRTKNQIMVEKLELASRLHNFKYFVFDSWYSNVIVIGKVKELKKKFITQIKSNRNVTIKRNKKEIRTHCKDIPIRKYTYETINNELFRHYETDGFISRIGTVKILYCQMLMLEKDKKVKWSNVNYIITNDIGGNSK